MSNKTFFEMMNSEAYKDYKDLTYKQLCNIAKEKKKYYGRYNKNELVRILGFEMINSEDNTGFTYRQLCNFARKRKRKYGRYTKNELEQILGFEISEPNEKKEKMNNPVKIIALNKKTSEILKFKSIYSTAKNFSINPGSIVWLINEKKELRFFDESFLISYG